MSLRILAIDTTTGSRSVALFNKQRTDALLEVSPNNTTRCILPLINKILLTQQVELTSLNALVCSYGPGSFTGVRVGIGISQGLALGANLPIIGVSSLATMAQRAWRQIRAERVLVAIDARMGEIYWAEYKRNSLGEWHGSETEALYTLKNVQNRIMTLTGEWITVGTAWKVYPKLLLTIPSMRFIETDILSSVAEDMIPFAIRSWQMNKILAVEDIQPIYFCNETLWKKLPGR